MGLLRMQADQTERTPRWAVADAAADAADMTSVLPDIVRCLHLLVAPCFLRDSQGRTVFTNNGFRQLRQTLIAPGRIHSEPRILQIVFERADQLLQGRTSSSWLQVKLHDMKQVRVLLSTVQNNVGDRTAVLGLITDPEFSAPSVADGQSPHHTDGDLAMRGYPDAAYARWATLRKQACERVKLMSAREKQVATLVAAGVANKVIAHKLDVSVKTIEKHRANAMRKIGVANSAELVRVMLLAELDGTASDENTVET